MPRVSIRSRFHRLSYICTILLLAVIFLSIGACTSEKPGPQISGQTMGTTYSIQWSDDKNISLEKLEHDINLRLEQINQLMSTYISDSQLSEFNQSRDTGWHAVDKELAAVVTTALDICQKSDGAFDITIGPLVNLWGFGANEVNFQFPSKTEINIAKRSIGCQHLETRLSPPAINKKLATLYVDLSAIAKGYAVDEVANILNGYQIQNYMVEIGGEVKAKGIASHGDHWRIGIETPHVNRGSIVDVISLNNISVATSGDYRNFFEHNGERFSHTIDPKTGYPIKHKLSSVTILHHSATLADAWATAFMVMGANKSLEIAKTNGLTGLLIRRYGEEYEKTTFGEMGEYLTN